MFNNSLIINSINKTLSYFQSKSEYLWENSLFLQNLDKLIFGSIIGVFVLATFASSDVIGYITLITLFLTIIKLFTKKGEKIEGNIFEFFILAYFISVTISLFGSTLIELSFKGFLKTAIYMGFYFSLVQFYKNNLSKIFPTIATIAVCAGVEGIVGIFQNFSQVGEISTWQDVSNLNPEEVMTRVYGTLNPYNPNLMGGYLVASLPSLFGLSAILFADKKLKEAAIAVVLTSLASFALVLTGCRGAYIGFMVIVAAILALVAKFIWKQGKEEFKRIYMIALGGLISFSTVVALSVSSIRARIFSIFAMREDSSTSFRFNVYQSSIEMFKDNWLLGIGVGNQNFREIYGLYMKTGFDALSSYCVFLELAVESGIFALLAFLAFLGTFIYKSTKFILSTDLKTAITVSVSLITVIAVMTHGLVDTIFFRPQLQVIFWAMAAFVSARLNDKNQ